MSGPEVQIKKIDNRNQRWRKKNLQQQRIDTKGGLFFCLMPERILPTMIITGYILLQDERD